MMPSWMSGVAVPAAVFLVVLGLCLGSFLNVVIHRLPRGESIVRPRSRCGTCGCGIAAYDNIPVLSYVWLRGRCRACGVRIPLRYPIVEIAGAVCLLAAAFTAPSPMAAGARALFLLAMLAVTWIDLDHRIIPDQISIPGVAAGLLLCPWAGVGRLEGLIGALLGGGLLLGLAVAYRAARGVDGMGMGDVKLAAMLGAFLGWKGVLLALILGSLGGSIVGIALMILGRAQSRTALPFGTFLAPAAAVVLLFGPRLWSWTQALRI